MLRQASIPIPRARHDSCTGFIQDLISAAIDVIFSPLEPIFAPLIEPLVDLIGLPEISFSISVSFEDGSPENAVLCACFCLRCCPDGGWVAWAHVSPQAVTLQHDQSDLHTNLQ